MLLVCAIDVITGLEYLHRNGIAHRDPKPGNTLVCNQHYDKDDLETSYAKYPIVCKLADFGLSRSLDIQARPARFWKRKLNPRAAVPLFIWPQSYNWKNWKSRTKKILRRPIFGRWDFSYTQWSIQMSLTRTGVNLNDLAFRSMRDLLRRKQLPSHDDKYDSIRKSQWSQLANVFKSCARFDPRSRPTAAEILRLLNNSQAAHVSQQKDQVAPVEGKILL